MQKTIIGNKCEKKGNPRLLTKGHFYGHYYKSIKILLSRCKIIKENFEEDVQ